MQTANELDGLEDAIGALRQACEDSPETGRIRLQLAQVLEHAGRYREATESYFDAIEAGFQHPLIFAGLAWALLFEGRSQEAVIACRAALAQDPSCLIAWSNLLFALNCVDNIDAVDIFNEYRAFGNLFALSQAVFPKRRPGRIRIGFLCAWFTFHPAGRFSFPVIAGLDRRQFEVYCYDSGAHNTALSWKLHVAADHWRDVSKLDDSQALQLIRGDDLDLLLDLDGHTGDNRLPLFAAKAARTQVSWLGYPNTTGLEAIDYRIIDPITDPEPFADTIHSEKLLRIPTPFLVFPAPEASRSVTSLPALKNGYSTFGVFNQVHKYSASAVEAIARVVKAIRGSHLVIRCTACLDPAVANATRSRFVSHGIDPQQIDCGGERSHFDFLSAHFQVDVMLDTFPYTGCTTTYESLWMGVPVVTLQGLTHRERVSSSLLTAAGYPGLIATSADRYVQIAVELADDTEQLASMRANMRSQLLMSPAMDCDAFVRRFESALLRIAGVDN